MPRPRNIPIDVGQGTSKTITVIFNDKPNLTAAQCLLLIKRHAVDQNYVLCKMFDLEASTKLNEGQVVWNLLPSDTENLDPRTYTYEIKIIINDDVYVPLIGDFNLFDSL
ncbi:MAG: hypothetical protein QXU40_04130 [Candidatus Pacearchaeota archaeon]